MNSAGNQKTDFFETVVVGNGYFPRELFSGIVFKHVFMVNPQLSRKSSYIISRARKIGAAVSVVINHSEPKPLLWRISRPKIDQVITSTNAFCISETECNRRHHRDRVSPNSAYVGNEVETLKDWLDCQVSEKLTNTGLLAIEMASKISNNLLLLGFDFYQNKNMSSQYSLTAKRHQKKHVKKRKQHGSQLFTRFETDVVRRHQSVLYVQVVESIENWNKMRNFDDPNYRLIEY